MEVLEQISKELKDIIDNDLQELKEILGGNNMQKIKVNYIRQVNTITFHKEDYLPGVWGTVIGLPINPLPF